MNDTAKAGQAAASLKQWLIAHPARSAAARFPIDACWTLLDERTDRNSADAARLTALEQRHERIWDIVLELRQKATARGLDPYQDPAAQALSAILTGDTGWRITYGTLVETRDDLEAAKVRAVALWERTKWEAEEHAHDWEQRPDGSLALVAWDEEQWFDCGPVIQPLTVEAESEPQIPGQTEIPAAGSAVPR